MSEEYKAKCKSFFDEADADGTGCVSRLELCKVAQRCGCNNTVDEISDWFDQIDKNDDDKLTFDEYWSALNKRDPADVTESQLRATFQDFDSDNSGYIGLEEVRTILEGAGEDPSLADQVLDAVDTNDDGKINAEEFLRAWKQTK
ncbi:calmodulin, striated muscle [Aplysia californica]|uniref:Calmodulin, striated muscle n=1 Tax=Aplysia californica TaxID=6500 RepID=A0ABM0ZZE6_APLCA|nr:calmodulin, striated muscle [Aplysia californica]